MSNKAKFFRISRWKEQPQGWWEWRIAAYFIPPNMIYINFTNDHKVIQIPNNKKKNQTTTETVQVMYLSATNSYFLFFFFTRSIGRQKIHNSLLFVRNLTLNDF